MNCCARETARDAPVAKQDRGGEARPLRVALAGNPNAGKTSLFNALTGARNKVGNYPGVTVEKLEGSRFRGGREYRFIDLPGIYSLTAYSIDEVVTRDFLIEERPDLIVDVLDSTNLERNLYLCLQFQELGIPLVGALNMSDEAEAKGVTIDAAALSALLGFPLVRTVGTKGSGIDELLDAIDAAAAAGETARRTIRYGEEPEARIAPLEAALAADREFSRRFPPRWLAVKLLEKDENAFKRLGDHAEGPAIAVVARDGSAWLGRHFGRDAEIVVSERRYGYIHGAVKEAVSIREVPGRSVTESIDRVIMNRFLSLPIFLLVLWTVFSLTFMLGSYPQAWLDSFFSRLGGWLSSILPAGLLRSALVDGLLAGVGGVFSFVPLIVILFLLLSILEDLGYMSRAAFACDKALHSFGLHGQSVFPMMLGFGCSVPAIMAARTLKSRRDRIVTILVIPFLSCSAKLPVYVLLAGAFFPRHPALVVMLLYGFGVLLSLLAASLLRRTLLRGEPTPFVMELPPYRAPTLRGILWHVSEKTASYLKKMGTVIMAASMLVWAMTSFPAASMPESERSAAATAFRERHPEATGDEVAVQVAQAEAGYAIERSAAGAVGRFVGPLFAPLGLDWKLSVATITGFAAKEVIVSTLGVLYRAPDSGEEGRGRLAEGLRADPGWSPLLALVMMLFTLAMPPCVASLAAIKAELGWGWLAFEFVFLFAVGWILGFLLYQGGALLGLGLAGGAS